MFDSLWQSLIDAITLQFISPFWYWCFVAFIVTVCSFGAAYLFPPLRSLAGAIVFAAGFGLYAYRRGEGDAERRQKVLDDRAKARKPDQPFSWPW